MAGESEKLSPDFSNKLLEIVKVFILVLVELLQDTCTQPCRLDGYYNRIRLGPNLPSFPLALTADHQNLGQLRRPQPLLQVLPQLRTLTIQHTYA